MIMRAVSPRSAGKRVRAIVTQDSPASSEARSSRTSASDAFSWGKRQVGRHETVRRRPAFPRDRTFVTQPGEHVAEARLVSGVERRHQLLVELLQRGDLARRRARTGPQRGCARS